MNRQHLLTNTRTYRIWRGMKQRCRNPRSTKYENYGGRGISYDPRWERFANFLEDMGVAPEKFQLDRVDNNGPYSKSNCRWATPTTNLNNKRNNRVVDYHGQRLTVAELAHRVGLTHDQIYQRICRGWSAERAVSVPFDHRRGRGAPAVRG